LRRRAVAACATATAVALGLGLAAGDAEAKKKKKKAEEEAVDVSAIRDKLVVLSDGDGSFIAAAPDAPDGGDFVFYSTDGKAFYQLRVRGGGSDGSTGAWDRTFWSPRVFMASIDRKPKQAGKPVQWALSCRRTFDDPESESPYSQLPDAEAKKILAGAQFRAPLWHYQAHFLARDDLGNYYYVDRLRDELGGKGFRLFKGQKGAMKEMPMTNIVSDSVGEIFTTKKGELRFVVNDGKARWVFGQKSFDLTNVPVEDNVIMIYGELGVYLGTLGTPCDDV
jgi:hypothetical protein